MTPCEQERGLRAFAAVLALIATAQGCGDSESNPSTGIPKADASIDESGQPAVCKPQTCEQLGAVCGFAPDGCGGKVECGTCSAAGEFCGGGGPNKCGTTPCFPKTCAQLGASCGYASDACSQAIDCGNCPAPLVCGGSAVANQCGCQPKSCQQIEATCGDAPDECGGTIECGSCPTGQICGGGGKNKCGTGQCTAKSCAQLAASCGFVSDQCSKTVDCGGCQAGETCGGHGVANQCSCLPKTCGQLAASCGKVQNGCGTETDCGGCSKGDSCGLVKPNQCSAVGGSGGSAGAAGAGGTAATGGSSGTGGGGGASGASGTAGAAGGQGGSCGSNTCGALEQCFNNQYCVARLVAVAGGYSLDATEVTRSQYEAWLSTSPATGGQDTWCSFNTSFAPGSTCMTSQSVCQGSSCGKHPQVCVDWCDAYAYCKAIGKRLCGKIGGGAVAWADYDNSQLDQWYRVCSSNEQNKYVYGNALDAQLCNGYDNPTTGCGSGACSTVEVGSLKGCAASAADYAGVYDLLGNVFEWEDNCGSQNGSGDACRARGGNFESSNTAGMDCEGNTLTGRGNASDVGLGLRCCSAP